MSIKLAIVGVALERVLKEPAMDDTGICQNLRIELLEEDLTERDIIKLNTLSANEFGISLNNTLFKDWPEHSGHENFPVGGMSEYALHPYNKWNNREDSGQKRRRLLEYCIKVCKESPQKELTI